MSKTSSIRTSQEDIKTYLEHIRPTLDYYIQLYNTDKTSQDLFGNIWSIAQYKAKFSETEFRFMTGNIYMLYHTTNETDKEGLKTISGIKDTISRLVRIIYEAPRLKQPLTVYCSQKERLYTIGNTNKITPHCILRTSLLPQIQHKFVDDSGCCVYQIQIPARSPLLIIPRNLGSHDNFSKDLDSYIDKKNRGNVSIEDFVPFVNMEEFQILLPPHLTFIQSTIQQAPKKSYATKGLVITQNNVKRSKEKINSFAHQLARGIDTQTVSIPNIKVQVIPTQLSGYPDYNDFILYLEAYYNYLQHIMKNYIPRDIISNVQKNYKNTNYIPDRLLDILVEYQKTQKYSMIHFIRDLTQNNSPFCKAIKDRLPKNPPYFVDS